MLLDDHTLFERRIAEGEEWLRGTRRSRVRYLLSAGKVPSNGASRLEDKGTKPPAKL
jgi:hypothetical protein